MKGDTTAFEMEICNTEIAEKLFQQNQIIADINNRISDFDTDLNQIKDIRHNVDVEAKFTDVYLLTVYQELWILKDFQRIEDKLVEKVNSRVIERNHLKLEVTANKTAIEQHKKNIESLGEQVKSIQNQFMAAISNQKFSDFLRKMFKKKFRVLKLTHGK